MIKNLGQVLQEVAEQVGLVDAAGNEDFSQTTTPTRNRVVTFYNDALKEVMSDFPYAQLETTCWLPFLHKIDNVPAAYLTGYQTSSPGTSVEAIVVPFPDVNALRASCYTLPPDYNFAGLSFSGVSSVSGTKLSTSTSGYQTVATWSGVGYFYELPSNVDSVLSISMPDKGLKATYVLRS